MTTRAVLTVLLLALSGWTWTNSTVIAQRISRWTNRKEHTQP